MSASNGGRLSRFELESFHARLGLLLDAGLPLPAGIAKLAGETRGGATKAALSRLSGKLEEGKSLAEAMAAEPGMFPADYVALVRVGEQGGDLKQALNLALEQESFQRNFRARLHRSLLYPGLAFVAVSATYLVLAVVSYPLLLDVLKATPGQAPLLSTATFHLFDWVRHYWYVVVVVLAIMVVMLRREDVKLILDRSWLKAPLLGRVLTLRFLALFSEGLAIALRARLPLSEALGLLAKVTANLELRSRLERAAAQVTEGAALETALSKMPEFPPLYLATLASGQEAGALPASMSGLARMYKVETESSARLFLQNLDTALILGLGGWVALILAAFYKLYITLILSIDAATIW